MAEYWCSQYSHRTANQLTFDDLRTLQFRLDVIAAYIRDGSPGEPSNEIEKIVSSLHEASRIIFDEAYMPLRGLWL